MQLFLSQRQYAGVSLKGSWFPCANWLPDVLHAEEYRDEVTQPPSPLLLQTCAVSIVALATWAAAANFSAHYWALCVSQSTQQSLCF